MSTRLIVAVDEPAMAKLLDQRYGDDLVYFAAPGDRRLYALAVKLGFVSEQGYVTPSGKRFWAARV